MLSDIVTLADVPRRHASNHPHEIAWWFEGRDISFGEFDKRSNQCAQALKVAGVKPGDRVAILAKNDHLFWILFFGAMKIRACLTPLNWRLAPLEVTAILNDSGARILFFGKEYEPISEIARRECPALELTIQMEPSDTGGQAIEKWIDAFDPIDPLLPIDPEEDALQLYTSGTTGLPKGVQLTHTNLLTHIDGSIQTWARWDAGKSVLIALPLFHVAGVDMGLLSIFQACRGIIIREAKPAELIDLISTHRIAYAFLVPTLINTILDLSETKSADFSSLESISYGASPISEDLLRRALIRFGCGFSHLYGMTETAGSGSILPPEAHQSQRLLSCGKPYPTCEVRVRDERGSPCEPRQVGEIQIRSKALMKGYWNRPEDTAATMTPDGWYKSGDAGYLDEDGYLYIHDRVKDMIISGGENIYPAEVENAIFGHPDVADVAVIGIPDDKWGEAVNAFVVLKPGIKADAASVITWARSRIASYKVPKNVEFIDALPRNPSGKVLRRELRQRYWEEHGRHV